MAKFKGTKKIRTQVGTIVLRHKHKGKGGGFTSYTGITKSEYERVADQLKALGGPNPPTSFQLRQLKLERGAFGRLRIVGTRYVDLQLENFTQPSFEPTGTIMARHLVDPD